MDGLARWARTSFFAIAALIGGCATQAPLPGTTTTDGRLQGDVRNLIMLLESANKQECAAPKIVNTDRPDLNVPIEYWTVDRCGKSIKYKVTLTPDGHGGTYFEVTPPPK